MKMKSKIREKIGYLKFRTIDTIPYKFMEKRSRKVRQQISQMAFNLPQTTLGKKTTIEIHMLCGKEQLDMGLWASWSILRFMKDCVLYVHSDGTLGEEDIRKWRNVVPSAVLVSREEADAKIAGEMAKKFPLLYSWRCRYRVSPQTVDMHFFGNTDRIIVMDSDVLCFKDPVALKNFIADGAPKFLWNKDVEPSYLSDIATLNSITGLRLPEAVNSGFLMTPRFDSGMFLHLESMLERLKDSRAVDIYRYYGPQTYYAMCVPVLDGAALPDGYSVTFGKTRADTILRHYVSLISVRPRYYLEGVPRLLGQIGRSDSLPFRVRTPAAE